MEHPSIQEPPGFNKLPKADQIRYLQALWDRIAENPADVPVPESHLQVAEQRLADYRRDPTQAQPAHSVLDRLSKRKR
jgi:putative addiction module component (TIGR02574 family)